MSEIESAERTVILTGERVEELFVIGFQENRDIQKKLSMKVALKSGCRL